MKIATLSDVETFEQTPAQQRWRGQNTFEMINASAAAFPDRPALTFQSSASLDETPLVITYTELIAHLHKTANALFKEGVRIGGVTSIILPSLPQMHYALWGGQALGAVGPINPLLEPDAIKDILLHSETEALVVLGPTEGRDIWEKVSGILDEIPTLKTVLQVNLDGVASSAATPGGVPIHDFDGVIARQDGDALAFERTIAPDDIAAYFHTGGTTGRPKLARHTHANQVHMASMMADMFDFDETTVAFGGLPLFHVNSFFNAGLNPLTCGGQAVYITPDGFRNRDVVSQLWRFVETYKVTYFALVPTVVSVLLELPIDDADISSLDFIICGAAPISPQVFARFQELTGINVIEAYGMTEGTLFSAGNPEHGEKRVGSIGIRVPYQPMKCVILDDDGRYIRDCATDEVGTIVIQGPNVFPGYKDPAKNASVFLPGGWLVSGDLAREDSEGYFWMTGRSKDLIIRGGHNIDPKTIEDALSKHPAVSLAAAVGQPDAYAGELPCAFVSLADDFEGDAPSGDDLKAFAKSTIAERAAAPVHVAVLSSLPVTAVGKIFKPDLRKHAISRVLEAALAPIAGAAHINVVADEKRGLVAEISGLKGPEADAAREVLGGFTVPYEFVLSG